MSKAEAAALLKARKEEEAQVKADEAAAKKLEEKARKAEEAEKAADEKARMGPFLVLFVCLFVVCCVFLVPER